MRTRLLAQTLNPRVVRELSGPTDGRGYVIYYDVDLPGFGLRVTKAGARSLVWNYRARGIERRMTIASIVPSATLEETRRVLSDARERIAKLRNAVKFDGVDPMAQRHDDRAAPTMSDLAARYRREHLPKKRSARDDEKMLDTIIMPAMRNRRVVDVAFEDVDQMHRKVTKGGAPVRANRVVSLLSKMFSLAISWKMRTDNPAIGIERNEENKRKKYLETGELARLSAALNDRDDQPSANAVRLLLLTGARRGEVLRATWSQFDLAKGRWTKPAAYTKSKKDHVIPLNRHAIDLLLDMHNERGKSDFLFPGVDDGPQQDLKRFWATVCKDAEIDGVRVHDLRHTYASVLANTPGMTLPVIGELLGHTNPSTTARYAHLFDKTLRKATDRAGKVIAGPRTRKQIERSASLQKVARK